AALIGFGAGGVCTWLALESVRVLGEDDHKDYPTAQDAAHNYLKAADKGLLKIMSKMGISTVSSYRGGQIFECLGLDESVVRCCFTATPNRIGGLGCEDLARPSVERHTTAFNSVAYAKPPDYGQVRFRRQGELHTWEPAVV